MLVHNCCCRSSLKNDEKTKNLSCEIEKFFETHVLQAPCDTSIAARARDGAHVLRRPTQSGSFCCCISYQVPGIWYIGMPCMVYQGKHARQAEGADLGRSLKICFLVELIRPLFVAVIARVTCTKMFSGVVCSHSSRNQCRM